MTRIGDQGGGQRFGGLSPEGEGESKARAGRDKPGLGEGFRRDMRFNQFDLGSGSREREDAFGDKVRRAMREAYRPDDADAERERSRLLAVAGVESRTGLPILHAGLPAAGDAEAPRADRTERIERMTRTVERALEASLRESGGPAFSLRIDLPDAADPAGLGLSSVTVTLSADAVDVVLARGGTAPSADLVAAAQALADRLHQRFSRRIVRVHEAEAAPAATASDGMEAIASLFRSRDAGR